MDDSSQACLEFISLPKYLDQQAHAPDTRAMATPHFVQKSTPMNPYRSYEITSTASPT